MSNKKKYLGGLVVVIFAIFFFTKNENVVEDVDAYNSELKQNLKLDDEVFALLKTSCFDCHSNNTEYPFYSIFPMSILINMDVNGGKGKFIFDDLSGFSGYEKQERLGMLLSVLDDGSMPLKKYTFLHKDAILDDTKKETLTAWIYKFAE